MTHRRRRARGGILLDPALEGRGLAVDGLTTMGLDQVGLDRAVDLDPVGTRMVVGISSKLSLLGVTRDFNETAWCMTMMTYENHDGGKTKG